MKTILITGANRGIGFETARQLALRGFHVVIGVRSEQQGQKALHDLEKTGRVSLLVLDVSDAQSIARAAGKFAEIGKLDVLINNAGIYPDEGVSIVTVTREQMLTTLQTNTLGPLELTQAFLPYLKKAAPSRVINLSSGYGQIEGLSANAPSYCLSKLALDGVTIMLAQALKADSIAVNAMCPGWVKTDMGGASAPRSVAEGADTAVWLAAEADQNVTGKMFRDRKEIPW
ncbi:short-chain dehydrogenase [Geomonas silvestris]|uniref:Short-chain dehydrogenase n=1 Tax=Geomonas silvestris TaxID=2740184 RepID=A0A6V8MD07_9BACT|nr:SDR family NAD(P)-dependent oxidoreductase [Geomonas silvestris]GFO57881.1 short-chain dehydrogenase [Geomonas silvestris]